MGLDFPGYVYMPCMEIFARQITVYPYASQPGAAPYTGRGIFDTNEIEIEGLDGSQIEGTRTELDIMESEWTVLPKQDDRVSIPADLMLPGGEFVVSSVADKGNAGGEITLVLKRLEEWKLIGYQYDLSPPDFGVAYLDESGGPNFSVGSPSIAIVPLTVIDDSLPVP
jgi:hypothetical protein